MADIKLESDYWDTSGIRDIAQNKTQRQINAEVKGSLNTKVLKVSAAISLPAQSRNTGWITLNGLTSDYELLRWNFSTMPENEKLMTLKWETDLNKYRISTEYGYPPADETCQPIFIKTT